MAFEGLRDWSGHVESLILCPLTTNELAVSAAEVMCRDGGAGYEFLIRTDRDGDKDLGG